MLTGAEWAAYWAINFGIAACYFLIPRELAALLSSHPDPSRRPLIFRIIGHFVFWCGVHHFVMAPAMFALMKYQYKTAFWIMLAADITTLSVSALAAAKLRPANV